MPLKLSRGLSAPSLVAVALAALLQGCSTTPVDETVGWSPNRLYSEAVDERDAGNHARAVTLFEKLEGRAAGTPLAQQAQLDKAYTQYRADEKAQALATVDRFMRLHPASPALDYALYLKGLINFNDNLGLFGSLAQQDLSERDQKAAKESYESFRELATRFPDSRYTPDAVARMRYVVNSLAQYEVHVARYYFSRGAYLATVNRAQSALTDYADAPALEEALSLIVRSYDALGMTQLRDDAERVLRSNYPNSEYLAGSVKKPRDRWWKLW
jgi:outer membrane protein assembly factor BamD